MTQIDVYLDNQLYMPVPEATIYLEQESMQIAVTDTNGFFMLKEVIPGTYMIKVKTPGYESHNENIKITDDKVTTINITLKKETNFLEVFATKVMDLIIEIIK